MNFSPETVFQPKDTIKAMQEKRLQELMAYLAVHSPFYKKMFADKGVDPAAVKTLEDLQQLPVTVKEDLQQQNEAFLCVGKEKLLSTVQHPVHWEAR